MNIKKSNSSKKKKLHEDKIKSYYFKMLDKVNKKNIFRTLSLYKKTLLIITIIFIIFIINLFSNIIKSNSNTTYKKSNYQKNTPDTSKKEAENNSYDFQSKNTTTSPKNPPQNNLNTSEKTNSNKSKNENTSKSTSKNESKNIFENLDNTDIRLNLENIIGLDSNYIKKIFGEPDRIDISENTFNWFVYNSDYSKFIMIGILENKCVCFYTNSNFYSIYYDISPGMPKEKLKEIGLTTNSNSRTTWNTENINITLFHNPQKYNNILGINVTSDYLQKDSYTENNNYSNKKYLETLRLQIFDLMNSYKKSNNLSLYKLKETHFELADQINKNYLKEESKSQDSLLSEELLKLDSTGIMCIYSEQNSIFLFEQIFHNSQFEIESDLYQYLVPDLEYNHETNFLNLILLLINEN